MRVIFMTLISIAASAQLYAQSAPAAASVTVGAGIKSFSFDWTPVSGASRYELWYRAHATSAFTKSAEYPAATTHVGLRISAHLVDWAGASYRVLACNAAVCTNSRDIPVASLRLEAAGYFKDSQPEVAATFGSDVDVAASGAFFVAAAPNDNVNGVADAGAAYVFSRNSDSTWSQRARLLPEIIQANGGAGMRVAISTDGNTVVMGLPNIFHGQVDPNSGEVYVFRTTGGTAPWQRTRIAATKRGSFGAWVSINDAGKVIGAGRDSGAELFIFTASGSWALRRAIENRTAPADNCPNGELSGDGRLLVESCFNGSATAPTRAYLRIHPSYASSRRDHDMQRPSGVSNSEQRYGLAVDFTGTWIAAQNFRGRTEVDLFEKVAGWHGLSATVTPGSWQGSRPTLFGQGLSLSNDGSVLAVGDPVDVAAGTGVQRGTLTAGSAATGAVYLFSHSGTTWARSAVVKPNYLPGARTFGAVVSLSESGSTLSVGEPMESSNAVGIDGAWNNTGRSQSGAVWLY